MYIQDRFRESSTEALHEFMRAHALATVVIGSPHLEAFVMPLEVVSHGTLGVLRGHVVRANHLATRAAANSDALAVFQGANAYISPRWYVNGQHSGRVAPSWNFSTVHAAGPIRLIDDAKWIHAHLVSLTRAQESHRPDPWQIEYAPADFIDGLVQRLIGIEIEITRLEGKRFLSQTRTDADRESVISHLRREPCGEAMDVAADIEHASPKRSSPEGPTREGTTREGRDD